MKTFTSISLIHKSLELNISNETNIYNNFINNGISIKTFETINNGELAIVNKELLFTI